MGEDVPAALFSFSKLKLATSRSKALREGMKRSICMTTLFQKVHTAGIRGAAASWQAKPTCCLGFLLLMLLLLGVLYSFPTLLREGEKGVRGSMVV